MIPNLFSNNTEGDQDSTLTQTRGEENLAPVFPQHSTSNLSIQSICSIPRSQAYSRLTSSLSVPFNINAIDYFPGPDLSRTTTHTTKTSYDFEDVRDSTEQETTPLPKMQMFVICVILISDPLSSTILLPFIYFMLKDFHLSDDEKEIGMYAGWITSIFFLAQFCTAIPWGKYSDKHGRRPVLLIGLIGNSLTTCCFGLSKSLGWAVVSRALCGVLNGNGGVARSMVSEITDETNRALAFSFFGFCWGLGLIGPALGGYLCNPVDNFPALFGGSTLLKTFPYFLPCLVSAIGSLVGFIAGYFYLNESNPEVLARQVKNEEYRPLLRSSQALANYCGTEQELNVMASEPKPTIGFKSITNTSIVIIAAYALFAFHCMVFDEILPLYFSAPRYAGGLGSSSTELAKALSIAGAEQLICQFVVYPRLNRPFSTLALVRFSLLLFIPVYILFPELSTLQQWLGMQFADNTTAQIWIFRSGYMLLLMLRYFANCLAFTGMMIMVNNSAAPAVLGTVNGVCQSCIAFVRAFAPTLGGTLWSFSLRTGNKYPFDNHMVYYLVALLSVFGYFQSFRIPGHVSLGGKKNVTHN